MSTKGLVLEILELNKGKSISGEEMASSLNRSRNMIWRAIKELRSEGYAIEAITNKGYRLAEGNDLLSVEGIKPYLEISDWAKNIQIYKEVDSTNQTVKAQAINRKVHGAVIISESQTTGRGRYGRAFYSPLGTGLYMSFWLQAEFLGFDKPTTVTAFAALCVCEAIEEVCGIKTDIKWVNDIFFNGKKVGGILTEALTEFESGQISEIILGIGINISTRECDFPEELQSIAGPLYSDGVLPVTRNQLAAAIINRILDSEKPNQKEMLTRYKERLFMLGEEILVSGDGEEYKARALDINEHGHLFVQKPDGSRKYLMAGEIRVVATSGGELLDEKEN